MQLIYLWCNLELHINIGILGWRKIFDIVLLEFFLYPVFFQNVRSLIISDGSFGLRVVFPDNIVAFQMYNGLIFYKAFFCKLNNAAIAVQDDYVLVAKISGILIGKSIVPAFYSIAFDPVAGGNGNLASVVCNKQMGPSFHDLMRGVVKEILDVEFKK